MTRMCSLFAGIGGFDLAAQRVGIEPAVAVEIEPFARKVLAKRFPETRLLGDVTGVTGADLGTIDLLAGGFPCQDVSVAGKRAGLAGERTGLFWEIVRLADECHPRWLLLENVPGLLSSNERRDFGAVIGALGELGYGYASRVLDAQYHGVAQRRRRVFIVGCLGDARRAVEVLFEPESCARHPAPSRQTGTRAAYSLTASVRGTGDGHGNAWNTDYVAIAENQRGEVREMDVMPSLSVGGGKPGRGYPCVAATIGQRGRGSGEQVVDNLQVAATLNSGGNSGGFRTEPGEHLVAAALLDSKAGYRSDLETETFVCQGSNVGPMGALRSGNGHLTGGVPFTTHALTGEGHDAGEDGTGRGTPLIAFNHQASLSSERQFIQQKGDKAASLAVAHGQAVSGPAFGVRRLMPVECERLQGFPDAWTCLHDHPQQCDCPDSPRYRALGNAVAVPVAEWILRRLVRVHNGERLAD